MGDEKGIHRKQARKRERRRSGQRTGTESMLKSPLSFVSSVIVDCDKQALSYLKPPIGQMVRPAERGGKEMGFTTELILGAAILSKPAKSLLLSSSLLLFRQGTSVSSV